MSRAYRAGRGWKAGRDGVCSGDAADRAGERDRLGRLAHAPRALWCWPASRRTRCAGRCGRRRGRRSAAGRQRQLQRIAVAGVAGVAGDPGARAGAVRSAVSAGLARQCRRTVLGRQRSELRRAQRLALAVRAEAHRMRTLLRFLPVRGGRPDPLPRLVRAGALRAGGERATDRAAISRPGVLRSSRRTARRTGMARNCGSPPVCARGVRTTTRCRHGGTRITRSLLRMRASAPRFPRPRRSTRRRGRRTVRRSVRWCCRCIRIAALREAMQRSRRLPSLPSL